jgi:hypothetical protein
MTEIPKEKFLFVIPVNSVAKKCCCCTLRIGVLILAILYLISNVSMIIYYLENLYKHWVYLRILIDVIRAVGSILLLYSLKNEKYKLALISYYIFAVNFLMHVVLNVSFMIYVAFRGNFIGLAILMAFVLSFLAMECWLVWIIFSYAKLLKYRQTEVIKGKPDVDFSYKNVPNELSLRV